MLICGGAMAGYWETGSPRMESAPASITRMPTTHAKIGRSMKNCGTGGGSWLTAGGGFGCGRAGAPGSARRLLRARRGHGVHDGPGPHLLQALDDHLIAGLDAARHEPRVAHGAVGDELAALDLPLGVHDERG